MKDTDNILRYDKNGQPYFCKTERRYGAINQIIMDVAARKRTFTRLDIPLDQAKARDRLFALTREGKIIVVRRGINGHKGQPAIYRINR